MTESVLSPGFRRDWSKVAPSLFPYEREEYPAPELPAVVVEPTDPRVGSSAQSLAAHAIAHGWQVVVSYAIGCPPHGATGKPTKSRPSVLVRGRHSDGAAFSAQWLGGACDVPSRRYAEGPREIASRGTLVSDVELRDLIRR